MTTMTDRILASMRDPSFYPHVPSTVELIQTHISLIFLAGDYVYKVKKPMDFGFLDFTSLDRRGWYCREELRLNRRLAPDTYLEVLRINEDENGVLSLGGKGRTVEYTLKMRRLPAHRMLKKLLKETGDPAPLMDRLARKIADFHHEAATGAEIDKFGSLPTVKLNQDENFRQTQKYIDVTIPNYQHEFIWSFSLAFMKEREQLFHDRVSQHRIREGHGDLHLEHICIDEEIIVFDCIEFNERFRCADVAAEVAFLAMDLDFNGYSELADVFVRSYRYYSGDPDISTLLNFYKAYYAFVRGKVTSFKLDDPSIGSQERTEAANLAGRYFDLAFNYAARPLKPVMVIMSGLMGTGKSVLAGALAERIGVRPLSSDMIRKELLGLDRQAGRTNSYGEGIYTSAITERIYEELFHRSQSLLQTGKSVVLDASFKKRSHRLRAAEVAAEAGSAFLVIECTSPEETIRQRLEKRAQNKDEHSDGRWELFYSQARDFETIDELRPQVHLLVDTNEPRENYLPRVLKRLREAGDRGRPDGQEK